MRRIHNVTVTVTTNSEINCIFEVRMMDYGRFITVRTLENQ